MINYSIQLNNNEFKKNIELIISNYKIDEIIETGTFHGDGSTKIFAETGKYVFTVECNFNNWKISSSNLSNYKNVCCIHGLSIKRNELMRKLMSEKFDVVTTYDSDYPKSFYMKEICQPVVVEDALDILSNNSRNQLIFLDSAGGVGYFEFLKLMEFEPLYLMKKVLILDDVSHIKHYRSVEFLKIKGFKVNISSDKRFAWCSFQDSENMNLLN